jgi:hypothetical protein
MMQSTVATLVIIICCAIIAPVSFLLVWHDKYEDGFFGRIALSLLLCAPCALVVFHAASAYFDDVPYRMTRSVVAWIVVGFTAFLCRHALRFVSYIRNGSTAWPTKAERKALDT